MRYLLTIAYDGTNYSGWQIQPNGKSIQEEIQKVLSQIFQEPIPITGAGRTDAGVHARDQKAHFTIDRSFDPQKLLLSLNALLPPAIRILNIEETALHARYSAKEKVYTYAIDNAPYPHPLHCRYKTHVRAPLNFSAIEDATQYFIGTHDFTSFANVGTPTKDNIRTIYSLNLDGTTLTFHGNGFLYKMVRNITGALLAIGKEKNLNIPSLFAKKDRRYAPPPAPPQGLTLSRVVY